ncbi:MAG: hypothetical protein E7250_14440 [Paenibacillaceae bacterium]|nr:hypothetical protein [Paenibacillaceae bacterium]
MEYYRITQKDDWWNVIKPEVPSVTEIWGKSEPFFLSGMSKEPDDYLMFLPFYDGDTFLISDPVKYIWKRYQKGGRYRPCAFGSVKQRQILPYCFMMPRILEAIHSDTEYFKNGDIRELVLNKKIIGANRVFGVRSLRRIRLIISADVLEEMIRENITGYNWSKVKISQE